MCITLGLDSSTQSLSATILDTTLGTVLLEASVNFGDDLPQYEAPNGFIENQATGEAYANPLMWLDAVDLLFSRIKEQGFDLSQVEALSGAGQQHGSVYLNDQFAPRVASLTADKSLAEQLASTLTRSTSPIWRDNSTAEECDEINQAVGGPLEVCSRSGSIAVERFTGPQIRRFSKTDPEAYVKTARIHLVSSFLASVFAGVDAPIDHADGAGMNLLNLATGNWDAELVAATADGLSDKLPPLAPSATLFGNISSYFVKKYQFNSKCQCVVWTGDNPSSLVGMGATEPGKVVISLGTSDTLFAALPEPLTDPNGYGHVFGNPTGGFMSLVCFRNGSLTREKLREQLGVDWQAFEEAAQPENWTECVMLPFLESEITPRTEATGMACACDDAMTEALERGETMTQQQSVRLLLEGQFFNMRHQAAWMQLNTEVIYLTGGASANLGIRQIVANVFGVPVMQLTTTGSVGLGAALQAAHVTHGESLETLFNTFCAPDESTAVTPDASLRDAYEEKLEQFESLLESVLI